MRTFAAVVDAGSFSRAADRLERSPQLVSKYVAQLETRLGVRLLNRSTRRLSITEAGRAYYERCTQVLADIDEMESAVADMTVGARGTLRINAPMSFGVTHLSRAIATYQAQQPDVNVELTLNDRVVDVISEGFDLAIRIAKLDASSLVARSLAPVHIVACASPDYLERHGEPATPAELEQHNCLHYSYSAERGAWPFEKDGNSVSVPVHGSVVANNGDVLRMAAIAGVGIVMQPTFIVGDDLRTGRLRQILGDYNSTRLSVNAVYAHRLYLSAKVRTFVDHLAAFIGNPPYWDKALTLSK